MMIRLKEYVPEFNLAGRIAQPVKQDDGTALIEVLNDIELEHLRVHAREIILGEDKIDPLEEIEADLRTHDLSVAGSIALIDEIDDPKVLQALRLGEMQHPKYEDGRRGVLEAISVRTEELL